MPPLFIAHAFGDRDIASLVDHIDDDILIYGVGPPETPGVAPVRTIERMAAEVIKMIRQVQPVGPYHLLGHSLGGLLAYEVATQLIGADDDVAFVGMIDTPCDLEREGGLSLRNQLEPEEGRSVLCGTSSAVDHGNELSTRDIGLKSPAVNIDALVEKSQLASAWSARDDRWTPALVGLRQNVAGTQRYGLEMTQYSAHSIPAVIQLFVVRNEKRHSADPLLGWGRILPQSRVRVVKIPRTPQPGTSVAVLAELGRALSGAVRNAHNRSHEWPESKYGPVTPLQNGRRDKPPLFCVPGAGDTASRFVELLSCIDIHQPVYGFEPRGLDGSLVPHTTVEAAASCYLKVINEMHLNREVHLLGHSFGGWVAFEMALRLLEASCRILSLSVIDSRPPDGEWAVPREFSRFEVFTEWIDAFELLLEHPLGLDRQRLESSDEDRLLQALHTRLVHFKLIPASSGPEILRGPFRTFGTSLRTEYRPSRVYFGPMTLMLVDDPRLDKPANRREHRNIWEAWKMMAPKAVCQQCPGNHVTILRAPNVHVLSRMLQDRVLSSPGQVQ
jgi:thioesterase domain-containing protein